MRTSPYRLIASLGFAAIALSSGPGAWADAACYAPKDSDGVFTGKTLLTLALAGEEAAPGQPQLSKSQFNGVMRCYARAAQRTPGFQGGMELGLQLGTDGKVKRVSVLKLEHNDSAYASCVAQLACGWDLANAPKGAESYVSFALGMKETVDRPDFLDPSKIK